MNKMSLKRTHEEYAEFIKVWQTSNSTDEVAHRLIQSNIFRTKYWAQDPNHEEEYIYDRGGWTSVDAYRAVVCIKSGICAGVRRNLQDLKRENSEDKTAPRWEELRVLAEAFRNKK